MMYLPSSLKTCVAVGLLGLLILTGCRTYGGHGSEEALFSQIQEANRIFADELRRAESDLSLLTLAADDDPRLLPFQARYESMTAAHEALLVTYREREEELGPGSSHRDLSRTLGALVADRRTVRVLYQRSLHALTRLDEERPRYSPRLFNMGMYQTTPVFFERVRSREDRAITMRRALAIAAEEAGLDIDEELIEAEDDAETDTVMNGDPNQVGG